MPNSKDTLKAGTMYVKQTKDKVIMKENKGISLVLLKKYI